MIDDDLPSPVSIITSYRLSDSSNGCIDGGEMITFLIVWALMGHAYWLQGILNPDVPNASVELDLGALVLSWVLGPIVWVLEYLPVVTNGRG